MDRALNREDSKSLMGLLGLNMEQYGNVPLMYNRYKKKCLQYHPEKGGNATIMKELNRLWTQFTCSLEKVRRQDEEGQSWSRSEVPTYGTPEWEAWWSDFNRDYDDGSSSAAEDETDNAQFNTNFRPTFSTPPKKKTEAPSDFPQCLDEYLSKALFSNKTVQCFLIYTTKDKAMRLYHILMEKFNPTFLSRHSFEFNSMLFLLTPKKHRVTAIYNFCAKHCVVSFLKVKAPLNPFLCYGRLCKAPFCMQQESVPGGLRDNYYAPDEQEGSKQVCWKTIAKYASDIECTDVYLLLGFYTEFEEDPDLCTKCDHHTTPMHFLHHRQHHSNAKLFAESKNQKSVCTQAVDRVIGQLRVKMTLTSRRDLLTGRFQKLLKDMEFMFGAYGSADLKLYMCGVAWYSCFFLNFHNFIAGFLKCMVDNIPKHRYYLFKGPIDSGKTTLASALLDLCGGRSLNVNGPFDRLTFELGCAMDQFMVCLDDVKGSMPEDKRLPTGQGVANLDHLRDHMDGCVDVNLEKKHSNKKPQKFPPGVVTMNNYTLPMTLTARFCSIVQFKPKAYLRNSLKNTDDLLRHRVLNSGITLFLLLIYFCDVNDFVSDLHEDIRGWKQRMDSTVSPTAFMQMKRNVGMGTCILEDEMNNETQDSGLESGLETETDSRDFTD
ncbi:large T antigen [African elephant polyomavirus 1]|uniref:DNA 3'-5' helicase n=2 Tax=African elephant polyomavirus 1 TaxID=1399914 RepID=T2FG67_9POLY|nr:large T antigen [African elephant polyomavirus 1]AGV77095.1 large T antigen [African elephant polyomavirus 1]